MCHMFSSCNLICLYKILCEYNCNMPQLIFYCHEFIVKFIFYALCLLFIFFKAFAWMDVQSDFTHMQDIDGKKKNLHWFWYLYHRYFQIILYKWNSQFLKYEKRDLLSFQGSGNRLFISKMQQAIFVFVSPNANEHP